MFEKTPELAPDLEWMLSSGQVDEAILIEALIHTHYRELFQLGLELCGISLVAVVLAQQTLASAVLNAHQYKGKTSVRVWLFRLALENWRHSSHQFMEAKSRLLDASLPQRLRQQFGFDHVEIDVIMKGQEINLQLDQAQPDPISPYLNPPPYKEAPTPQLNETQEITPVTELESPLSNQEIAELKSAIQDEIAKKRRSKTMSIRIQALAWMVIGLILVVILSRVFPLITGAGERTPTPRTTSTIPLVDRVDPTATTSPTPFPTPVPPHLVVYTVSEGDSLDDVARKFGVSLQHLSRLNNIPIDQYLSTGQKLIIGRGSSRYTWNTTPTPFTSPALPPPLTLDTNIQTIQQRVVDSRTYWLTLWAEVQVSYYGPFSYIGPPKTRMYQTWFDQTINSSLTLGGGVDGNLRLYDLRTDYSGYEYNFEQEERQIITQTAFSHEIHHFLTPAEFRSQRGLQPGESLEELFEIQTIDQIAGRDALVLDWYSVITDQQSEPDALEVVDQGRYWIDTQLGVVLRHQIFYPLKGDFERHLVGEYQVRKIVFNAVFSYHLFEPYRELPRRFAQDYLGEPLPEGETLSATIWDQYSGRPALSPEPPPANFDPASGQLTFHYKPDDSLVDVYSNGYFLGGVITSNPFFATCARSPNGRLIALAHTLWDPTDEFTPLHWFDLHDLNPEVETTPKVISPPDTKVTDFAFSPDNRSLAYFGCARETECAIKLMDLQTREQRKVISLLQGTSLTWSPDGYYLALLVAGSTPTTQRILVIDLSRDELVYSGEIDPISNLPADDSPTHDWGVSFPRWDLALDSCAFPPP